jgi:hypothetical protein
MTDSAPLLLMLVSVAACGPTVIRAYSGPDLPPGQMASLWSNENMSMSVNEQTVVSTSEIGARKRIELAPGRHIVTVMCRFSAESTRVEGGNGRAIEATHLSRPMKFALIAEGGHSYVPRAHFAKDDAGRDACQVLFPDITSEPGGERVQTF